VVTDDSAESLNPRLLAPDRIPKIDGEALKFQQIPATVVRTVWPLLGFRPRALGFVGTLFPYSFHQAVKASIVGPRPRAFSVILYSTRGGTSENTVPPVFSFKITHHPTFWPAMRPVLVRDLSRFVQAYGEHYPPAHSGGVSFVEPMTWQDKRTLRWPLADCGRFREHLHHLQYA
jgi:hypothetical protein